MIKKNEETKIIPMPRNTTRNTLEILNKELSTLERQIAEEIQKEQQPNRKKG